MRTAGGPSARAIALGVTERAEVLRGILRAGAGVLAILAVVEPCAGASVADALAIYGTGLALHLAHLGLLRVFPARFVSRSHCITYLVWITVAMALRLGGLRAPAALVYPPIILITGLVWSRRAAYGMAVASAAAAGLLVVLEERRLLGPRILLSAESVWLVLTACVIITAVIFHYASAILERAIDHTLRSERELADLIRTAPDAIVVLGENGRVHTSNPAAARLFEVSEDALVGRSLDELFEIDDERRALLSPAKAMVDGGSSPAVDVVARVGSARIPVEVRARAIGPGGHAPGVQLAVRDVRERRRAEEERERLRDQLRQAQRLESLGRLAGGVAHDFNNLLTIILGSAEMIASAPEHTGEAVRAIQEAAARASGLTRQLLALGRRQVFEEAVVDLNDAVASLEPMLRRLLPEDVAFRVDLGGGPAWIRADRSQLEQVVINLVTNARDASASAITVATSEAKACDVEVELLVADDGVGMTEEVCRQIFEPFFTTKEGAGTGLGMATVQGIVAQLGGEIVVDSAPRLGTKFCVRLPRAAAPAAPSPRARMPSHADGSARILVVEDEPGVRTVLSSILASAGYNVLVADGASSAERVVDASATPIDLLVTDVLLRDGVGRVVAESLRARLPSLAVLFVSGHAERLVTTRGMLSPGTYFLPKPFTRDALLAKVAQVLASRPVREPDAPDGRAQASRAVAASAPRG